MLRRSLKLASAFSSLKSMNAKSLKFILKPRSLFMKPRNLFSSFPPHIKLTMPALSPTMNKGNIAAWLVKEGDKIEAGAVICDVETDKATVGFEVQEEGYLAKILLPEGSTDVDVGELVCIIVDEEADVAAFKNYKSDSSPSATPEIKTQSEPQQEAKKETPKVASPSKSYPEHVKLTMPALSPTMSAGKISQWLKQPGDSVTAGDVICEVETDKAAVGYEIQEDGVIAKILAPAGDRDISIGETLAILVFSDSDVNAFSDFVEGADIQATPQTTQATPKETAAESNSQQSFSQPQSTGDRIFISPLAKNTANSQSLDISQLKGMGSGPQGRILNQDVNEFLAKGGQVQVETKTQKAAPPKQAPSKPAPVNVDNPYEDIPLTNMRKVIASRLLESKTTIPHYYLTLSVNMDEILTIRAELNKQSKVKISINDLIIKATALACRDVPESNSQWNSDFIRKFKHCDVSMAVATEKGLITPIVFTADTLGLSEIAAKTKELAAKARENKLQPHEFMGGTISISNLGNFGIDHFSAVINPPQVCISSNRLAFWQLEEPKKP